MYCKKSTKKFYINKKINIKNSLYENMNNNSVRLDKQRNINKYHKLQDDNYNGKIKKIFYYL